LILFDSINLFYPRKRKENKPNKDEQLQSFLPRLIIYNPNSTTISCTITEDETAHQLEAVVLEL
jgi:hypothetical protein